MLADRNAQAFTFEPIDGKLAEVEILDKETGISPGQACVFYRLPLGKSLLTLQETGPLLLLKPVCSPLCFTAFYAVLCYAL